jgi:hypothetical protein
MTTGEVTSARHFPVNAQRPIVHEGVLTAADARGFQRIWDYISPDSVFSGGGVRDSSCGLRTISRPPPLLEST